MKIIRIKQAHNFIVYTIISLWLWVLFFFGINKANWYDPNNPRESQSSLDTSVSVRIVYDFNWYIKRWRAVWDQFFTWNIWRTNDPNIYVKVWADKTSSYQLTWWILPQWSWAGIWNYNTNQFTILSGADGIKYIYSDYTHIWGIYYTWVVPVWLDRTWPSKAKINFTSWAIFNEPFTITWTDANIDTWVWREKYIIHIAMDPEFKSEIKKNLYTESYYLDTSKFPLGTIWRYIESVDYLWNSTPSDVQYFHNTLPSIPNHWAPNIPDDLRDYYGQITSDRNIQDISTWKLQNIFDIFIKTGSGGTIKYTEDDIKAILIYNYLTHGVAEHWEIPTWVPKTWVDGIMRYLDEMVKDINEEIADPTIPIDKSYIITGILLLILCVIMILRSRLNRVDSLCDDDC